MKPSRQFLFFCVVGTIGLGVDVGVLYAAAPWLNWHGARVLSFLAAATATWALNRHFTFQRHDTAGVPVRRSAWVGQYLRYLMAMLVGGSINFAVYALLLRLYQGPGAAALGVARGKRGGPGGEFLAGASRRFHRGGAYFDQGLTLAPPVLRKRMYMVVKTVTRAVLKRLQSAPLPQP